MKKMIYVVLVLACFSCTDGSKKTAQGEKVTMEDGLPVIDLQKEGEKREVYLQDIADVEYIPLETTDEVLLEESYNYALTDKHILYFNRKDGKVFIFDRQGKIKHHFGHKGGGPGEYVRCSYATLDDDLQEVYVADQITRRQILVYSFDGKFKRSIRIPFMPVQVLMNIDGDNLFHFDTSALMHLEKRDTLGNYRFISKADGRMTAIPLKPEEELPPSFQDKDGNIRSISIRNYLKNGDEIVLADFAGDTLYSMVNRRLFPLAVKSPSPLQMTTPILVAPEMRTERYLFLTLQKRMLDGNKKFVSPVSIAYDLKERKPLDLKIVNKDAPGMKSAQYLFINSHMETSIKNCGVAMFTAYRLKELLAEGKLKGQLKEIASTLKEDDNPVLMLVKFKE